MASKSRTNDSDSDDLVLIEVASNSRKRKSITLIDDFDDGLDKPFNYTTNIASAVTTNKKQFINNDSTELKSKNANQITNKKQLLSERIDRLCEYAQVLMHCLLFKINYYNKKTHFEKYLKYNTIVYVNETNLYNNIIFK